jgi:hypothetical protein
METCCVLLRWADTDQPKGSTMKITLAATAAALAFACSPAWAQPPQPATELSVQTDVTTTPSAVVETRTEVVSPVQKPALDPVNPIVPEVQAVVNAKPNYTTADLVEAAHKAMMATPISVPTTTITTTLTTPKQY